MKRYFIEFANVVGNIFRRGSAQSDLEEEIAGHIELLEDLYKQQGMTPAEASRAARQKFGSQELLKEECRDAWGTRLLEGSARLFQLSWRKLFSHRLFSAAVVATLGLCFGLSLFAFSLFDSIVNRESPFANADRVAMVWSKYPNVGDMKRGTSISQFIDRKEQLTTIENGALAITTRLNVGDGNKADLVDGLRVTPSYFETLGFFPMLGRAFTEEDVAPGSASVVILTHRYWQNRFNGDSEILGRIIMIDNAPSEVVGILGADYILTPLLGGIEEPERDVLLPFRFSPFVAEGRGNSRHASWSAMYALLREGVSLEEFDNEVKMVDARNGSRYPQYGFEIESGFDTWAIMLRDEMVSSVRSSLWLLVGAVTLLLIIGCVNTTGLVFGHCLDKLDEWRAKLALGVSWQRVFAQLYCDSLLYSAIGLALGVLVAQVGFTAVNYSGVVKVASHDLHLALDGRAVLVAIVLGLATAFFISSIILAWMRMEVKGNSLIGGTYKSTDSRSSVLLRNTMVVSQVAITIVLLIGTGLLLKSLNEAQKINPGFDTESIHTAEFIIPRGAYNDIEASQFMERLQVELEARPGVISASIINNLPFSGRHSRQPVSIVGRDVEANSGNPYCIFVNGDESLAQNMGIPLIRGRYLEVRDGSENERVCLIDETLDAKYFPNTDALGQQIRIFGNPHTVVGIVGAAKFSGVDDGIARPCVYSSFRQFRWGHYHTAVRLDRSVQYFDSILEETFASIDSNIGASNFQFLDTLIDNKNLERKLVLLAFAVFSTSAFALSTVGYYSLVANSTRRRNREFGIRIAVGASSMRILFCILQRGMAMAVIGIVIGGALALVFAHSIEGLLFRIPPFDSAIYLGSFLLVLVNGFVACMSTGLRIIRLSPVDVLDEA